jgi:DNA topoisomerase IB
VIKETAKYLRNTVAVCRKYYIHPSLFEADKLGKLYKKWKASARGAKFMAREEKFLLSLLKH